MIRNKNTKALLALSAGLMLSGCMGAGTSNSVAPQAMFGTGALTQLNSTVASTRIYAPYVNAGLAAMETGDLEKASKEFNHALKFDPTNANLHFLNALAYHLRAENGDGSQYELAKVGYDLALRYDPNNYWAAYQLGQISYSEQAYKEAQDAFAYALLYDKENPTFLDAMAVASYYAQDLETSIKAISPAGRFAPDDQRVMQNNILINSAVGNSENANAMFADYRQTVGTQNSGYINYLSKRVDEWGDFYGDNANIILAQDNVSDILGSKNTRQGIQDNTNATVDNKNKNVARSNRMVMVDVIIIRSEEINATSKGLNLLGGLSSTLSGSLFNYSNTRTDSTGSNRNSREVLSIAPSFSISADYSLNIFNDAYDKNEVLARPTLIAEDGLKSEFFSGAVFHVELGGSAGSLGAVQEVPVGIKLDVTPRFVTDNKVQLNVAAARAFVEGRSSQIGFNNFAQISKTMVTANVTMNFGDTLILSGLSEKESGKQRSGVPILGSIPGIQYLFSSENTLEFTRSVIILMTPRRPEYTNEDGSPLVDIQAGNSNQKNLTELRSKNDYFKPNSNMDAAFFHLKDNKYFREFRSGDVRMENWNTPNRVEEMTENALKFLWY